MIPKVFLVGLCDVLLTSTITILELSEDKDVYLMC